MVTAGAHIRRLQVSRFRGLNELTWRPAPGLNVVLGGGDVGKSTLLDALALLLSPANSGAVSDADYFARDIEKEFVISAVVTIPSALVNQQQKMAWPWEWDGKDAQLPPADGADGGAARDPVYRIRVRGTSDADLVYEIEQPDGSVDFLSTAVRRAIGLVRLGEDRNDRDLRLVYGSALERLLDDKTLRSRLAAELAKDEFKDELLEKGKRVLAELDGQFKKEALPPDLGIGLTGGPGLSLGALIGLTAKKDGVNLPLATWGAGTRRLASLAIASALQTDHPIMVVDELERGLEPYRQRQLVAKLAKSGCQVFATTHSSPALQAARGAALWYVDAGHQIAELKGPGIERLQERDSEALLSKLTLVMEGRTEIGFGGYFIRRAFEGAELAHGVWLADGQGNEQTLTALESLSDGGLRFGGFVDNEGSNSGRWKALRGRLGPLLFQWPTGSTETNVVPLFKGQLEKLIDDPAGALGGQRRRTLATRLGTGDDKSFAALIAKAGSEDRLVEVIVQAASGFVPDGVSESDRKAWQSHAGAWFKSTAGGHELAHKVDQLGLWPKLEAQILPFLSAVREVVGLSPLGKLP